MRIENIKFALLLLVMSLTFVGFLSAPTKSFAVDDEDSQFQRDTETEIKETTEQKDDGTQTRTIRAGRVRQREGGERVGEIEQTEVKKYKRRHEALNLTALGFGPYGSTSIGKSSMLYGFSLGKVYEVSDIWDIRGDIFVAANSHGSFINAGIGPTFIPLTGEISPLIGFELGFGYADGNVFSEGGFYGQVNLGLKMFRLANKQLEILGTAAKVFTKNDLGVYGVQMRILF